MQVSLVPAAFVPNVRPALEEMLQPACDVTHGRYTTTDVFRLCEQGTMLLWIAFDDDGIHGCQVTQIIDYPSRRCLCSLFTAGRRLRHWREPMMEMLIRFARDEHCTAIEGQGREAWVKMLEPYGCRRTAILFEKDI